MIPIKRNSSTHLILSYLKVVSGKPRTIADIKAFSPQKFKDASKIKKSLNTLIAQGFVVQSDNCYNITSQGISALKRIAIEQKSLEKQ